MRIAGDSDMDYRVGFYPSPKPAAPKLEQAFLEEMMKYLLPKASDGGFSGGVGEEQFASFLNREYAAALAQRIDLGLEVGS